MSRVDRKYIHHLGVRPDTADMPEIAAVWAEAMTTKIPPRIGIFAGAMALGVTATSLATAEIILAEPANTNTNYLVPKQSNEQTTTAPSGRVLAIVAFLNRPLVEEENRVMAIHLVQPGDSPASLANQYYGDSTLFHHIVAANRHDLTPTGHVKVGQSLRIPEI